MRRLSAFVLGSYLCLLQLGCPGGSGGSGDDDGETFEIDGTWKASDGTTVAIDGSTGRLTAFPLGPVFGREVFDVGDEYFRGIEREEGNRYDCEIAQLQLDEARDALTVEAVSYETCTLEPSQYSLTVTRGNGETEYWERLDYTVERRGGACEGRFWAVTGGNYYLCSDAYSEQECNAEALGKSSLFSEIADYEFSEGKTCPELGYGDRFDEPALYQFAPGDNTTPGSSGHWSALAGSDAETPDPDDAGMHDDAGFIEPAQDGGVEAVQYLVFGTAWDHAAIDCPEGSATFEDWTAYYYQVVDGEWNDTYEEARAGIEAQLMSTSPGALHYYVESSWFEYGREASHAVIIEYAQTLLAWDCRPQLITIGYGRSYEEALAQALETKANNDSESAPYTELQHVTWQP